MEQLSHFQHQQEQDTSLKVGMTLKKAITEQETRLHGQKCQILEITTQAQHFMQSGQLSHIHLNLNQMAELHVTTSLEIMAQA